MVDSSQIPFSVEAGLAAQLLELEDDGQPFPNCIPYGQDIEKAVQIKDRASLVANKVFQNVRMGKPVTLEPVKDSVHAIIDSIQHNPDSLLSLLMLKNHDEYTFMHSVNACILLTAFCQSLQMDENITAAVGIGGILHDIGKARISNQILDKPGPLTNSEFARVRRHVEFGTHILERTPNIHQTSIQVVSQHHERLDGSGYPHGLKGDQITRIGQMVAIVDIYDAITTTTSYHKGKQPHDVLKEMMSWRNTLIDDTLLQQFVHCVGIYPIGTVVMLENGLIGVVTRPNRESLLHPTINIIIDSQKKKGLPPKEVDLFVFRGDSENGYQIKNLASLDDWGVDPHKFIPTLKGHI